VVDLQDGEEEEEEKGGEKQGEKKKKGKVPTVFCPDEDEEVLIRRSKTGRKITPKRWSSVEGYY